LLRTENLNLFYTPSGNNTQILLENVNFVLPVGSVTALSGPSGGGKTLLALAACGLSRYLPGISITGTVLWNNVDVYAVNETKFRKENIPSIGIVWQHPMSALNPVVRIKDQWKLMLQSTGVDIAVAHKVLLANLSTLMVDDVEQVMSSFPHELSTGQLQRILVAMCIARNPKLLITDEATASLDNETSDAVMQLISTYQKKSGCAWLMITHKTDQMLQFAHQMVYVDNHTISGHTTQEVINETPVLLTHPGTEKIQDPVIDELRPSIIAIRNLSFSYPATSFIGLQARNKKMILENLNLDLRENTFYGLLGSSGSGKSTLGKIITGLATGYTGDIYWKGTFIDPVKQSLSKVTEHKIQLVFQDAMTAFDPFMTIDKQLIEFAVKVNPELSLSEQKKRISLLLEKAGVPFAETKRLPRTFSGGQIQRISLVRTLLLQPEMIIFDETFSALDEKTKNEILRMIHYAYEVKPFAALFISHDREMLEKLCKKIYKLEKGHLSDVG
jgi:peptide/nickel transport system ATP-binding protein